MPHQTPPDTAANKALFLHLLTMLSMSAMQDLGKLKHQLTGKIEVHLELAQATIDMLDMLEAKTRGNRDADEDRAIKDALAMLKLNYVETREQQAPEPQQEKAPEAAREEKAPAGRVENGSPGAAATKDPKYHKSYS